MSEEKRVHPGEDFDKTYPIWSVSYTHLALLHDIAKPAVFTLDAKGKGHFYDHELVGAKMARDALKELRYSRAVQEKVELLTRYHMLHLKTLKSVTLKRFLRALPKPRRESLEEVLLLQKADLLASRYTEGSIGEYERFAERSRTVLASLSLIHI